MRELQAKHGIEVQRAKDLEEALAQREVDLKTKSVELNELEGMVAKLRGGGDAAERAPDEGEA